LCAELHEGAEKLRQFQNKPEPIVNGKKKVSVTSLMAAMAVELVNCLNAKSIIVLDAYFAVGPVFMILKDAINANKERLAHIITRAKSNVVGYQDPPPKTGCQGRPRKYGQKLNLMDLFGDMQDQFQETAIDLYGQQKTTCFLCLDLIWKPIKEKVRFILVSDDEEDFILMCSDLSLSAHDIIRAYSYRFKIEVNFKVLKHLMGVFFYHFWTSAWPHIGKRNESDLSTVTARSEKLIAQTTNAIEAFVSFGCIATGILQIVAMNFHQNIWKKYLGWLRTVTSIIPSEETVRSVIQEEYFHNFRVFSNTAIYEIIMSKSRKPNYNELPLAA
jgi:hypothetical protein